MCRSPDGFVYSQRDRLKIKAFSLQLSISKTQKNLPETITLHYLPRISGTPLEINDTKIRSDSPAFITLHRLISAENYVKEACPVYASRDRVRAGEAVRFEVYVREEKLLKGTFRIDNEEEWKIECESAVEEGSEMGIKEVEVSVAAEGHVAIVERVDIRKRRRRCNRRRGVKGLELDEIPEEREEGVCDCCCDEAGSRSDSEDDEGDIEMMEVEAEAEGMRWAVDVGIWVMCFGVGYLVSKASSRSLIRRKGMFL